VNALAGERGKERHGRPAAQQQEDPFQFAACSCCHSLLGQPVQEQHGKPVIQCRVALFSVLFGYGKATSKYMPISIFYVLFFES
jgi:hypothetical protein